MEKYSPKGFNVLKQYIERGSHHFLGFKGNGPRKVSKLQSRMFMQTQEEIRRCKEKNPSHMCENVSSAQLDNIPKHEGSRYPTKETAEKAKKVICLSQRVCPVFQHSDAKKRGELPCAPARDKVKDFLGQD